MIANTQTITRLKWLSFATLIGIPFLLLFVGFLQIAVFKQTTVIGVFYAVFEILISFFDAVVHSSFPDTSTTAAIARDIVRLLFVAFFCTIVFGVCDTHIGKSIIETWF